MVVLEMRTLMRGLRGPVALFLAIGFTVGLTIFLLLTKVNRPLYSMDEMARLGRLIFMWLIWLEIGLVSVLMPILTMGMIMREYTRLSIESLLLTQLSSLGIVAGKLLAGASLLGVTLLATVPVIAVVFLLGGVSPWELAWALLLLVLLAAYQGAVGIYAAVRVQHPAVMILILIPLIVLGLAAPWVLLLLPLGLTADHHRPRWRLRFAQELARRWLLAVVIITVLAPFAIPILGALGPLKAFTEIYGNTKGINTYWWTSFFASAMLVLGIGYALVNAAQAVNNRQLDRSERYQRQGNGEAYLPQPALPTSLEGFRDPYRDAEGRRW
jgi:ABC-type transport system involved in multi-copper enzyme maturation permease subunit